MRAEPLAGKPTHDLAQQAAFSVKQRPDTADFQSQRRWFGQPLSSPRPLRQRLERYERTEPPLTSFCETAQGLPINHRVVSLLLGARRRSQQRCEFTDG
jgi:hypothetical protein